MTNVKLRNGSGLLEMKRNTGIEDQTQGLLDEYIASPGHEFEDVFDACLGVSAIPGRTAHIRFVQCCAIHPGARKGS